MINFATMKKLVIFDLDGTLLNTVEDLGNAVNGALSANGYPTHGLPEYKKMVGNGVRNLVSRALPQALSNDNNIIDRVLEDFFKFYRANISTYTTPYPGISEMLERLGQRGYLFAVASNKFQEGTESLVRHFFSEVSFVSILGNRPGRPLKPSPEIVNSAIANARKLTGEDIKAVMVGDSAIDMATAAAASIPAIGVSWGFRGREELSSAGCIVDDALSLTKAIEDLTATVYMTPSIAFVLDKMAEFNKQYFSGTLPEIPVKLSKAKSYLGKVTYQAKRNIFGKIVRYEGFKIWISTAFNLEERELEDVIIHEMIHYYILFNKMRDTSPHGKIFRKMMNDINESSNRNIRIRYKLTPCIPSKVK